MESVAGAGVVVSHCNGNSVSPVPRLLPQPQGAASQLWEGKRLMAADSSQAQLPSHTAGLPVAWLPGTPCLPNTAGRGGGWLERMGISIFTLPLLSQI